MSDCRIDHEYRILNRTTLRGRLPMASLRLYRAEVHRLIGNGLLERELVGIVPYVRPSIKGRALARKRMRNAG